MHEPAFGKREAVNNFILPILVFAGALLLGASPALAEVSATIEIKSDDRFRGRSLSDGQPVIVGDINIDTDIGIYTGGSMTAILSGQNRAGFRGGTAYVGHATRFNSGTTVDIGAAAYAYTRRYGGNRADTYGEIYAGVTADKLSVYVHYAPNYFDRSVPVVYGNISAVQPLGSDFTLKAHAGMLAQTSGEAQLGGKRLRYDTRIALSRPVAGFEVEVALIIGGPNDIFFKDPWGGRSAFTLSAARHF